MSGQYVESLEQQDRQLVEELLAHLKADIVDTEPLSEVAAFYANRSVFITGGTGFIGKALVEKLIRSCPDIKRIYLLIRDKRGKNAQDRLAELKEKQIFNRIKSLPGGSRVLDEKLRAIGGNMTSPGLGVLAADMEELSREVSLVLNSAATIRFDEPIDVAVRNNIQSLRELVKFCDKLAELEAIVHISTAYANCNKRDTIHEIIYDPPMRGEQIIEAVETLKRIQAKMGTNPRVAIGAQEEKSSRSACEQHEFYGTHTGHEVGPDLVGEFANLLLRSSDRPNTYTLTKAISESYLLDILGEQPERYLGDQIQLSIVRPSIVSGAWRQPLAGYVDNTNGATGTLLCISSGILQAFPSVADKVADLVPVDMVSNSVICAGYFLIEQKRSNQSGELVAASETARAPKMDSGIYLFNIVSGPRNPICWHPLMSKVVEVALKYPMDTLVRVPSYICMSPGILYELFDLLNHRLPAYLVDLCKIWILRQQLTNRTSCSAMYSRISRMKTTLVPFSSRQWSFSDSNVISLHERMSEPDRRLFPFDVAQISWPEYISQYVISARTLVLHEKITGVPNGRRKLRKRQMINRALMTLLFVLFYYILLHRT